MEEKLPGNQPPLGYLVNHSIAINAPNSLTVARDSHGEHPSTPLDAKCPYYSLEGPVGFVGKDGCEVTTGV